MPASVSSTPRGLRRNSCAERPFEQLDLLAQRGLLDAKPRRRAGDVQFLGDDEKVAEQSEVHVPYPKYMDKSYSIYWICRPRVAIVTA